MKVSVDRDAFAAELKHCLRVVGTGAVIPITACVRIDTHEGALRLFATNLQTSLITSCAAEIETSGGFCAEAKLLSRFASDAPAERIEMALDGGHVTLTAGASSRLKIPAHQVDEFPTIPEVEDVEAEVELPAATFANLITRVMYAVDQTELRDFCKGPIVIVTRRRIDCAATNGNRFAMASATIEASGELSQTLQFAMIEVWIALDPADGDVSISVTSNHVFLLSDTRTVIGLRIEAERPDIGEYAKSGDCADTYTVGVESLRRAVGRTAAALVEKRGCVILDFGDNNLRLSTESYRGNSDESIAMESHGKPARMGFSASYLRDACAVLNSTSASIMRKDRGSGFGSITLRPEPPTEGIEELHLIMSMRL